MMNLLKCGGYREKPSFRGYVGKSTSSGVDLTHSVCSGDNERMVRCRCHRRIFALAVSTLAGGIHGAFAFLYKGYPKTRDNDDTHRTKNG
jgi:hypothetical protein